jgi:hypothetical protein
LGRSSTGGGRRAARRAAQDLRPVHPGPGLPRPSLDSATLPRVWQGVGYRPLPDAALARTLFDYAALPWPEELPLAFAWGASTGETERLIGAILADRADNALMLHGPVVVDVEDPLEVATQLVAAALDHAAALQIVRVYTRPQGLDRVWVRFGFVPVPENDLPRALAGRSGTGLYVWRGGTALSIAREAAAV